jgi:hypothetical protein
MVSRWCAQIHLFIESSPSLLLMWLTFLNNVWLHAAKKVIVHIVRSVPIIEVVLQILVGGVLMKPCQCWNETEGPRGKEQSPHKHLKTLVYVQYMNCSGDIFPILTSLPASHLIYCINFIRVYSRTTLSNGVPASLGLMRSMHISKL